MQQNYAKIQGAGLGLAAISYDSPEVLKTFAARKGIAFPLLSDKDSRTIRAFGILNSAMEKSSPFYGIPNPGIYFLSPLGVVNAKYFEDDYRERQSAAVILMREFGIQPPPSGSKVLGKHLTLRAGSSDDSAHMGRHIALTLDIDLPPKVHVYAPGVQGYIPIDWQQTETAAAKTGAAVYPVAKTLFLPAINEKVPVFEGHFRLTRDVVLGSDKDLAALADKTTGNITLQGALRYQACDDEKCFLPETVPISWTMHYEPLDRVRATAGKP